jgi:uncharacterized protein
MNQLALVTGASGGIGEAIARELARKGFDLVLVARSKDKLEQLATELSVHNVSATAIAADLGAVGGVEKLVLELASKNLHVDILINNAGFGDVSAFAKSELTKQLQMIQLNITALTELTHRLLPGMLAKRSGKILNVASTAGFFAGPFMNVYYASKHYVIAFSEGLREELVGSGVSVTVLCPGPVLTGFQKEADLDAGTVRKNPALTTADFVAQQAVAALLADRQMVIPGWVNTIQAFSARFMPRVLIPKLTRSFNEPK